MGDVTGFAVLPWGDDRLAVYTVPGTAIKLSLRKDSAPLLLAFARDFHQLVESLILNKCGGHNYRYITGTTTWSRHARGIAIDLNWSKHPVGAVDTFSKENERIIHTLLAKYSYGGVRLIRWGGDYSGRKDEMHFEIDAPHDLVMKAVAAIQHPAAPRLQRAGSRTLRLTTPNLRGEDVKFVQRFIGPRHAGTADGVFGPATKAGVVWYQKMRGVTADGVVGPQTWRQMGIKATY